MDLFKNLLKGNKAQQVKNETNFVGRTSIGLSNPGRFMGLNLHSDTYASAYPSIRAISNEYMTILPKAIDGNGKTVKSNILDALYHPNQLDSVVSFSEKIAVSTLVLPKTYILVWRKEGGVAKPGGDFGFKGRNIAGFTFLENPGISRREGKTYYNVGSQWFTEDEVLVLNSGVDPHNLYDGYSPTMAASRWITLDDYIADFQKGFFENNAIPAGMFKISAATPTEFEDIVRNLKNRHKGAGSNNNVTYSHAPVDPNTGKVAEAKIEWIPFQQSNKDIDFKSLFEQANRRIDQAYGVSSFIKGVDDAPNYATAQVSEANFAKRAVKPLLTRNYAQLTHELNRITGGMGLAISFDYEIPAVADEDKVVAETHVIHANLLTALETSGYSLDSIVDAFDLPARVKLLKRENSPAVIDNDKPQVDEGGEVETAPDPDKIDGIQPLNKVERELHCKACDRFLGVTTKDSYEDKLKCSNSKCKALDVPTVKEAANAETLKAPKNQLPVGDVQIYEQQLEAVIRTHVERHIDRAIAALEAPQDAVEEDTEEFTDDMMVVIVSVLVASGALQMAQGLNLLSQSGIPITGAVEFTLTEAQEQAYRGYLSKVSKSFWGDTAKTIEGVLNRGNAEGWTRGEVEAALRNIVNTDEWRIKRLAVSEINTSLSKGGLFSMQQIQDENDVELRKVWTHWGADAPCADCQAMIGKTLPLDGDFLKNGASMTNADGKQFTNTWRDIDCGDLHANGHCGLTYEVV